MDRDYLEIGMVTKVHGIRGDIKIVLFAGVPVDLGGVGTLRFNTPAGVKNLDIEKIRVKGRTAVITLAGLNDRDAAAAMVGARIEIARDLLPAPGADEFFWHELVGLDVFVAPDRELGRVADIFTVGAGDIIVVRGRGHEYLIPARAEFVVGIDIPANRIFVSPPEGLLELYE